MADRSFWERPEVVARFAARAADLRLVAMLGEEGGEGLRCLDLGCAGGRNATFLAQAGADVWALDASAAMVAATRERLALPLGPQEAERRVLRGKMDDLGAFGDATFDLVVALGVYQDAADVREFGRAVAETARVLRPGGRALVATFSPDGRPGGEPPVAVQGRSHVYLGHAHDGRPMTLLRESELDALFASHGLEPLAPTRAVRVETERGYRITLNALYRRTP